MYYLNYKKKVRRYSGIITFALFFENALIISQAIRGKTSHFNISTAADALIFNFMGVLILVFTIAVVFICVDFFRQRNFNIHDGYVWGIRLGLVLFIIFSLEGGMMISMFKHTVGANDETGLAFT